MIFLRFSTEFTRISKTHVLFENLSFAQAPGKFFSFTLMPLVRAKLPGKKWRDAIGSLGEPVAVLAGIRRLRRGFWPGRMWRRYRGSPWLGLRAVLGVGRPAAGVVRPELHACQASQVC
jgi:hypothetical protein